MFFWDLMPHILKDLDKFMAIIVEMYYTQRCCSSEKNNGFPALTCSCLCVFRVGIFILHAKAARV